MQAMTKSGYDKLERWTELDLFHYYVGKKPTA